MKEVNLSGFLKGLVEYFRSVAKSIEQKEKAPNPTNPLFFKVVKQFANSAQEFLTQ